MTSRTDKAGRQRVAIGSNPERNRAHNRRVVLEVIRIHGHLGRTRIARLTHLTAQAVANIVSELLEDGLIVEQGRLRKGRGQPPIQFAVNLDGPLTAGVEIATDHLAAALVDLSGRVRAQSFRKLTDTGPAAVPGIVAAEIRSLQTTLNSKDSDLLGVGIVMPGPFEIEGMSSTGPATLPGWTGTDPAALFAEATGHEVVVDNDANAAVVAERLYGAGQQLRSFCYLYFGIGLGLGIIHEGRPLRGAFGNAGEIGHIPAIPRNGVPEGGNPGPLERSVSIYALRERLAATGQRADTPDEIRHLHEKGDPVLAEWIALAADYLAPIVVMLENIFDPETIIFGGGLPDSVLDAIIAALEPLPVSVATRRQRSLPRVIRGQTGALTATLGAAALPLLDTLSPHLGLSETPG